ncbi:MAG TPA: type II toxin-antitoxin system HicA family toxin [Myxococcota bacterium]|nr:type II toxin-antitoxin system HicA family toxin [Myxococcota bacterium]
MDKRLAKMRQNPRDWRIGDLETVAAGYGFRVRKSGGSHVVFLHDDLEEALTVPAHRPIKPVYVRRLVKLIDKLEEEKEEEGNADGHDEN